MRAERPVQSQTVVLPLFYQVSKPKQPGALIPDLSPVQLRDYNVLAPMRRGDMVEWRLKTAPSGNEKYLQ